MVMIRDFVTYTELVVVFIDSHLAEYNFFPFEIVSEK